jgi:hypothetical protein
MVLPYNGKRALSFVSHAMQIFAAAGRAFWGAARTGRLHPTVLTLSDGVEIVGKLPEAQAGKFIEVSKHLKAGDDGLYDGDVQILPLISSLHVHALSAY